MNDAGSEAKRDFEQKRPDFKTANCLAASLGTYEQAVRATLAEADKSHVIERI